MRRNKLRNKLKTAMANRAHDRLALLCDPLYLSDMSINKIAKEIESIFDDMCDHFIESLESDDE